MPARDRGLDVAPQVERFRADGHVSLDASLTREDRSQGAQPHPRRRRDPDRRRGPGNGSAQPFRDRIARGALLQRKTDRTAADRVRRGNQRTLQRRSFRCRQEDTMGLQESRPVPDQV
jgi:hypothetical protein